MIMFLNGMGLLAVLLYRFSILYLTRPNLVSRKSVGIVFLACAVVHVLCGVLIVPLLGTSLEVLGYAKVVAFVLTLPLIFILYRRAFTQTVFLLSMSAFVILMPMGFGNLAEVYYAQGSLVRGRVLNVVVSALVLFAVAVPLVWFLRKLSQQWGAPEYKFVWWLFLPIPLCIFLVTMVSGNIYSTTLEPMRFIIIRVLNCVTLVTLLFVMNTVLKKVGEVAALKERMKSVDMQLDMQRGHYNQLTQAIEETKKASHDLRHHLAALQQYAAGGDTEGIQEYLSEYMRLLPVAEEHLYCRDHAVNAVVNHYFGLARAEGIEPEANMQLPDEVPASLSIDFCVVLGNLLENAIDGCRTAPPERRVLKVNCGVKGKNLILSVVNGFDGVVRRADGGYLSTKRDGQGIGLVSVRTTAEKHGGVTSVYHEDERFTVNVGMRLPQESVPPVQHGKTR